MASPAESGATTQVYLAANPSHLEAVDPVLEGIVRAKQDLLDKGHAFRCFCTPERLEQMREGQRASGKPPSSAASVIGQEVGSARTPDVSLSGLLAGSVALAVPLVFGSLGGLLCERSGVVNIAIEGQLLAGAFMGAVGAARRLVLLQPEVPPREHLAAAVHLLRGLDWPV